MGRSGKSAPSIARRRALAFLAGAVAGACPLCGPTRTARAAEVRWTYSGNGGPEEWGRLSPEFRACDLGRQQSPVDLTRAIAGEPSVPEVAFQPIPLRILNNGHTIQVNAAPGSWSRIGGERFELLQFHFHHPSEHTLDGRRVDLEVHFVHRSAGGRLAVLGVFFEPGAGNPAVQAIWAAMPKQAGPEKAVDGVIDPNAMLPRSRQLFRYTGSLTTPPCGESVLWTVFRQPIAASADQIKAFAEVFPMNARPVQPLHQRILLESRS
jgi:carbonic anhydrase